MSMRVSIGDVHVRREDYHLETFMDAVTQALRLAECPGLRVYTMAPDDEVLLELCAQWLAVRGGWEDLPGVVYMRSETGGYWEMVDEGEMIERAHAWAEAD